jgi:hypothetical protein
MTSLNGANVMITKLEMFLKSHVTYDYFFGISDKWQHF